MYLPNGYKLKYKHVAFKYNVVNLVCKMLGVTPTKKLPKWFEKVEWNSFNHVPKVFQVENS
jgi:hypothetical protein